MTNSRFPDPLTIGNSGISGCGLCQTTTGRGSVETCRELGLRGTLRCSPGDALQIWMAGVHPVAN